MSERGRRNLIYLLPVALFAFAVFFGSISTVAWEPDYNDPELCLFQCNNIGAELPILEFELPVVPLVELSLEHAATVSPGEIVGSIEIPKLGISLPLSEMRDTMDTGNLDGGPAHVGGTSLPGTYGNCAIAGHRSTYTKPFARLDELAVGDEVTCLDTAGRRFLYRVRWISVVAPDDVSVLDSTAEPSLTLICCHPYGSDASRLIVRGELELP